MGTYAIVGSRAATEYGMTVASDIAADLAREGHTIVSGGAYGIDAAAHRGALAVNGHTVAVLPCGRNHLTPRGNAGLFRAITEHGGELVFPFDDDTPPSRERFLARNLEIAKRAVDGVIVVEASLRSGSLNTMRHARELGRPVFAVPGPVTSATSAGPHDLIRSGKAVLVNSAAEVLDISEAIVAAQGGA